MTRYFILVLKKKKNIFCLGGGGVGVISLDRVEVPSPKIVINLSWTCRGFTLKEKHIDSAVIEILSLYKDRHNWHNVQTDNYFYRVAALLKFSYLNTLSFFALNYPLLNY